MFSEMEYLMKVLFSVSDVTGSQKSNMVDAKPEMLISQPVDEIETNFKPMFSETGTLMKVL